MATHSETPRTIHNAAYAPENHPSICYCGFEQCERRRLQKDNENRHNATEKNTQSVNDTLEWNEPAEKNTEIVIRNVFQKDAQTDKPRQGMAKEDREE